MNYYNYLITRDQGIGNAAACLLSLANYHNPNYAFIMEQDPLISNSYTLNELHNAAMALGFKPICCQLNIDSLMKLKKPAVLEVVSASSLQYYYLVLFELREDCAVLGDTLTGQLLYMPHQQLDYIWVNKKCLLLETSGELNLK